MDESVASLPIQTNLALQSARLDALQRVSSSSSDSLSPEQKAGYAKAARGFESMFVHEMYKTMRESMLDGDDKNKEDGDLSFGNDTLEGYTDMQFSDYVSQNGHGMGLAELLYKTMTHGDSLPTLVTQHAQPLPIQPASQQTGNTKLSNSLTSDAAAEVRSKVLQQSAPDGTPDGFITRMSDRLSKFDAYIQDASTQFGVPTSLIKAIITTESAANPNAVSSVGAKGLMQLMNGTAKDVNVSNPFDPQQNIRGGTEYIARMIRQFGNLDHAVAAYNAGPGNVEKHNGIPPFSETQAYVRKVRRFMNQYAATEQTQNTEISS